MSLDEGTMSARAALYDEQGLRTAMESEPLVCRYPHSGWVEQDADEIWHSQLDATRRTLAAGKVKADGVAASGITNQRDNAWIELFLPCG